MNSWYLQYEYLKETYTDWGRLTEPEMFSPEHMDIDKWNASIEFGNKIFWTHNNVH